MVFIGSHALVNGICGILVSTASTGSTTLNIVSVASFTGSTTPVTPLMLHSFAHARKLGVITYDFLRPSDSIL